MSKKYKLQLELLLEEENDSKVIEAARRIYGERERATEFPDDGPARATPADEFIDGSESALMELVESNRFFEELGIEVLGVSCAEPADWHGQNPAGDDDSADEPATVESASPAEGEIKPDLDEFETGLYLCRWPNGSSR